MDTRLILTLSLALLLCFLTSSAVGQSETTAASAPGVKIEIFENELDLVGNGTDVDPGASNSSEAGGGENKAEEGKTTSTSASKTSSGALGVPALEKAAETFSHNCDPGFLVAKDDKIEVTFKVSGKSEEYAIEESSPLFKWKENGEEKGCQMYFDNCDGAPSDDKKCYCVKKDDHYEAVFSTKAETSLSTTTVNFVWPSVVNAAEEMAKKFTIPIIKEKCEENPDNASKEKKKKAEKSRSTASGIKLDVNIWVLVVSLAGTTYWI